MPRNSQLFLIVRVVAAVQRRKEISRPVVGDFVGGGVLQLPSDDGREQHWATGVDFIRVWRNPLRALFLVHANGVW